MFYYIIEGKGGRQGNVEERPSDDLEVSNFDRGVVVCSPIGDGVSGVLFTHSMTIIQINIYIYRYR